MWWLFGVLRVCVSVRERAGRVKICKKNEMLFRVYSMESRNPYRVGKPVLIVWLSFKSTQRVPRAVVSSWKKRIYIKNGEKSLPQTVCCPLTGIPDCGVCWLQSLNPTVSLNFNFFLSPSPIQKYFRPFYSLYMFWAGRSIHSVR